jgi:HTH-type transcriptional regulator/antitoxin HigA
MSMEIRPIKNNCNYREALKEIDQLMDARPNTAEGDRLDVLVTLVEEWEETHWPTDPPNHPDEFSARRFRDKRD